MTFGKRTPIAAERRERRRHISGARAFIVTTRNVRVECVITNISASGALLAVQSVLGLPEEFELVVPQQFSRTVYVVRRGRAFLGVRFARPISATPTVPNSNSECTNQNGARKPRTPLSRDDS